MNYSKDQYETVQAATTPLIQFDKQTFIGFLMKVSILHESDMDEINKFSEQVNSEDDALYHLSDYFERLGDTEHFENAEKTLESYKNYLVFGEIQDDEDNSNKQQVDQINEDQQIIFEKDRERFHHLHHEVSEVDDQLKQGTNYQDAKQGGVNQNSSQFSQHPSPNIRQRYEQNGQIHERLYQQAFNKQEFQILMGEIKKEQEVKECTFSPNITISNRSKSPNRQKQDNQEVVFQRLAQKKGLNMKDQLSSWQKREETELAKCTFKPQINKQKKDNNILNMSGTPKHSSQEKVFDRLYNRYGIAAEQRKFMSKNSTSNKGNMQLNINSMNRSSNQLQSQKERDLLEEEQMITPAKLKNKQDFLKWQVWNQQFDDNSDHNFLNSGSNSQQYSQQFQQSQSNYTKNQAQSIQSHSRSITPTKLYGNQYRSISSVKKEEEKISSLQDYDSKQVHERLYDLHFQRMNKQLVKEVEQNYMQQKELSFKPEIYTHSYREKQQQQLTEQFSSQKQEDGGSQSEDLFQRLYDKAEEFKQRVEIKRKEKEDQLQLQLKQCHPQINKKSDIIAQNNRQQYQQSAFDRMYEKSKQKDDNYQKLKQKVEQEEGCTFQPTTNKYHKKTVNRKDTSPLKHNNENHNIQNQKNNSNFVNKARGIMTNQQGQKPFNEQTRDLRDQSNIMPHKNQVAPLDQFQKVEIINSSLSQNETNSEIQITPQSKPTLPFNTKKNNFFS